MIDADVAVFAARAGARVVLGQAAGIADVSVVQQRLRDALAVLPV